MTGSPGRPPPQRPYGLLEEGQGVGGGQDGHLDFHTQLLSSGSMLLDVHRDRRDYQGRAKEPKTTTELRGCVNREAGLGSLPYPTLLPSLISHVVSVDGKHHKKHTLKLFFVKRTFVVYTPHLSG